MKALDVIPRHLGRDAERGSNFQSSYSVILAVLRPWASQPRPYNILLHLTNILTRFVRLQSWGRGNFIVSCSLASLWTERQRGSHEAGGQGSSGVSSPLAPLSWTDRGEPFCSEVNRCIPSYSPFLIPYMYFVCVLMCKMEKARLQHLFYVCKHPYGKIWISLFTGIEVEFYY